MLQEREGNSSGDEEYGTGDLFSLTTSYVDRLFTFGEFSFTLTLSEAASTDYDLTGQVLWPAARHLCDHIVKNKEIYAKKKILELGSGVGMSGVLVSMINREDCVLTDGNKTVMELLQKNADRTNEEHPRAEEEGSLICHRLKWGTIHVERFFEKHPRFRTSRFDLIIGSDIIYFPDALADLLDTVNLLLSDNEGAAFILCYQERAKNIERRFYDLLEASPLQVASHQIEEYAHTLTITRKSAKRIN